ncbi:Protein kinase domain-containing protein [Caenorhabditis elegans]|uniref:Protein kinase domain-containing protein n=1 Tax=Caenorhabditis elegans TaxID=6239 RepID=E9P8A4_CAEEL|nr:Protein kinase domain-containing protein [Caenorhabditis elegans]CBZ41173.1 Protein kinase domain-containing protein [Caenorhabditis elegans]|eukprot:NP_001251696.1 Uncharacterized protein CELE_W04G5.16 [Caenorhabditis elegans]
MQFLRQLFRNKRSQLSDKLKNTNFQMSGSDLTILENGIFTGTGNFGAVFQMVMLNK